MTMVERVARALFDFARMNAANLFIAPNWESLSGAMREHYTEEAKFLIAAMREPTDEMKFEAQQRFIKGNGRIIDMWHGMIDAALSEGSAPRNPIPPENPESDLRCDGVDW